MSADAAPELIEVTQDAYDLRGVVRLTLNRPQAFNALSEALLDAVIAGLGIALLPTWLISDELRSGRLVTLLHGWNWLIAPSPERAIWGIYPPKKVVSPKVKSFLSFLSERFGHPAYWDRP